jgi:hypothetical protein
VVDPTLARCYLYFDEVIPVCCNILNLDKMYVSIT